MRNDVLRAPFQCPRRYDPTREPSSRGVIVRAREYVEIDSYVAAVGLVIHPFGRAKLLIAPGSERSHGHDNTMVRAGLGYDFQAGKLTVTPTVRERLNNCH